MKNVIKYTKQYTLTLNGTLSSYIRTTYDLRLKYNWNKTKPNLLQQKSKYLTRHIYIRYNSSVLNDVETKIWRFFPKTAKFSTPN